MVKKIIKVEVKNRKNREIRSLRSLVVSHDPSLEAGYGAHPPLFLTSAIQMIFGMPLICIIMRAIREWRPHDLIYVREAVHRERHEEGADRQRLRLGWTWSVSNASKRSQWCIRTAHTRVRTPILRTAPTNVQLRRISGGRAPSLALDRMRSDALRLQFC